MKKLKRNPLITSKIMSSIPSKNTKPENQLAQLLKQKKIKFVRHFSIIGSPDFAILSKKIAIFVDGDFWHGHNWKLRGLKNLQAELNSYNKYWSNKIQTNIRRDKKVNRLLSKLGWKVVRVWESNIKKYPNKIICNLVKTIQIQTTSNPNL